MVVRTTSIYLSPKMSLDYALRAGGAFEGGKAERELGLTYTPIGVAIEEEVASHKGKSEYGRTS